MTTASEASSEHAYARFTRRVQGVFIDAILFSLVLAGALIIAISFASDNIARFLGFTFAATWLLYEPIQVSVTGGTVGHYLCNMRVVDDRGGNISFGKAVMRMIIKSGLSWYSFIAMAVTSRHQAVHDVLTRSTVQMRNLAKAKPHHFSTRQVLAAPAMPSRSWRVLLILAYGLGWLAICWLALIVFIRVGLISGRCLNSGFCNYGETLLLDAIGLGSTGISALIIVLGWRGRLWGG